MRRVDQRDTGRRESLGVAFKRMPYEMTEARAVSPAWGQDAAGFGSGFSGALTRPARPP
jgi:hypothetical protein